MTPEGEEKCECKHYEKYTDMLGYTRMLRQETTLVKEQVRALQQVNRAFQLKLQRGAEERTALRGQVERYHTAQKTAVREFEKSFKETEKFYTDQILAIEQQANAMLQKERSQHTEEILQAIGIIEGLKHKLTLAQKTSPGPRSTESSSGPQSHRLE